VVWLLRFRRPQTLMPSGGYPPVQHDGIPEKGVLIYIKASLSGDEDDYPQLPMAMRRSIRRVCRAEAVTSPDGLGKRPGVTE